MEIFERRAYRACSRILLLVNLLAAGLLTVTLFRYGTMIAEVFADFNTSLPWLTMVALGPWFKWVPAGLAGLALLKEPLPNKRATLILNGLTLLGLYVLHAWVVAGFLEPLLALIRAVAGP